MSGRGFTCAESPQECKLCGKIAECRPYGKNGEEICVKCAKKDVKGTEKRMKVYLFGREK